MHHGVVRSYVLTCTMDLLRFREKQDPNPQSPFASG
jgi:hypothetical protein